MRGLVWAVAAVLASAASADAAIVIDIGTHSLAPNTPDQTVTILVSRTGSETVTGLNFVAQIGDGGVDNGGTDTGPVITDVDLLTGTPFAGGSTYGFESYSGGLIVGKFADCPNIFSPVVPSGTFATLKVSTVGIHNGDFALNLNDVFGDVDTSYTLQGEFAYPQINNGLISVPEPGVVMALAATSLSALALRKRKTVRA